MTRPLSRRALLAAPLALAACGFAPALAPGMGPAVRLADPVTRLDFAYRAALEDRLGPAPPGAPLLSWRLEVDEERVAITAGESTRRLQLTGRAAWILGPAEAPAAQGVERAFTAYDATGTTLSVAAARRDAEDRLAAILADATRTRLLAFGA